MRTLDDIDYENDWKMINIQIGSNDMCGACNTTYMDDVTPDKFGGYVESVVERIQANIPKTLVNLIGAFNVSQIFPLSAGQDYCPKINNTNITSNTKLCSCAATPEGLEKMGNLTLGEFNFLKKKRKMNLNVYLTYSYILQLTMRNSFQFIINIKRTRLMILLWFTSRQILI